MSFESYWLTFITENAEEYQRWIRKMKRGPYSLSATATRVELHRKHPRGENESIRKKTIADWLLLFADDKPP